jgi:hypothetical protein
MTTFVQVIGIVHERHGRGQGADKEANTHGSTKRTDKAVYRRTNPASGGEGGSVSQHDCVPPEEAKRIGTWTCPHRIVFEYLNDCVYGFPCVENPHDFSPIENRVLRLKLPSGKTLRNVGMLAKKMFAELAVKQC